MNSKNFVQELLKQFLLTEEADAIAKLGTIKAACEEIVKLEPESEFAKGLKYAYSKILEYINDEH